MNNLEIIKVFTNNISLNRIESLYLFGTFAFDIETESSDLDLYLILNTQLENDYLTIQQIITELNYPNLDFTLDYLDQLEQKGWSNYQFKHHGIYFAYTLANASAILLGENILLNHLPRISKKDYFNSVQFQCDVYFKRIQEKLYNQSFDFVWYVKYFKRICIMILTLNNELNTSKVTIVTNDEIIKLLKKSNLFSFRTKELVTSLLLINSFSEINTLLVSLQTDINHYFKNKI
jgi:predicted nucleotidyltransferase